MVFDEAACKKVLKEEGRLVEVIWPDVTADLVNRRPKDVEIWSSGCMHVKEE